MSDEYDDYGDDYTPSVDQVRETFADAIWDQYGDIPWSHWAEGYDRMIKSVEAAAEQRGAEKERERIARNIQAAADAAWTGTPRNAYLDAVRIAREDA